MFGDRKPLTLILNLFVCIVSVSRLLITVRMRARAKKRIYIQMYTYIE